MTKVIARGEAEFDNYWNRIVRCIISVLCHVTARAVSYANRTACCGITKYTKVRKQKISNGEKRAPIGIMYNYSVVCMMYNTIKECMMYNKIHR